MTMDRPSFFSIFSITALRHQVGRRVGHKTHSRADETRNAAFTMLSKGNSRRAAALLGTFVGILMGAVEPHARYLLHLAPSFY